MLDWINATLPDKDISNFTTDWNDGINLSALVNYCKPSLIPNHPSLDPSNATENVSRAMTVAENQLGIPKLIQPDELAAESPDERSVMTYLFLFCGPASPGQEALLSWIQKQIPSKNVTNFTTDWVNGEALGMLVNVVSASAFPAYDQYKHRCKEDEVENCQKGINAAEELLGIESTLEAEEFANPELNPLSRATYLIQFYHAKLRSKVMDLHIPSKAGSGEMAWLDLVCPEESSETVQGYAKGKTFGRAPVTIENLAPSKFRVKFQAKHADLYTLAVYVNGSRVKGSPFEIDLTVPDPSSVELTNTIIPKKVGLPVSLFFNVSGAGNGEITGHAIGEKVGRVSLHVEQMSTSTRKVSFIPFEGDVYTLEVKFAGTPVPDSPFVFPLNSITHPESVKCGEPEFSEPHVPVRLDIDASNAGTGKLTAKCRGETSGEMDVDFTGSHDNPNGLTFTPTAEDVYTLSIYFDDTEVNGSPFSIDLHPIPPDASKVTILEAPSGNLNTGDQLKISFDTSKAGSGTLTASCEGNEVGEVAVSVVKTSRQHFDIVFVPPEEDVYTISILWADSHIRGSPFAVNLIQKDKPDPSKCKIVSPLITASLGSKIVGVLNSAVYAVNKEVSFEVDTAQAGKGSLTVTAISQEGESTTPHIEPIPERPRVFKVRYTPTTPGTHTFDLLWANEAIPSSPLSFEVIDAKLVPLGIPIVINMTAYCRKRHLKVYAIHHEKNTQHKMKIDKLDKSHFHLTLKPKDEGLYHVHVLHQDKEFPGSPLNVHCSKAIKHTSREDGYVEFVVDAVLAGLDDIALSGMKHSSSMSTIGSTIAPMSLPVSPESVTLTQVQDGSSSPDEQASPSLSHRGSSVDQTPTGKGHFKWGKVRGTVAGLNLQNEKFRVGFPHSFKLHCEDLGKEAPEITCKPPSGAEINLSPAPGENSHWVEIVPKKAGKYELSVKFNGKHILGSPFNVQFSSRSDASKCVLEDSPPECQKMSTSAENIIFCVSNKGAGKGKLTAVVKSNTTKETLPVSITRPLKHHYHVEFTPSEGLDYTLTIKYDDFNIPGSPFKLVLGDASKCRMEGEGTVEAWLNEQNRFTVNAQDAGPGQLKVIVEGEGEIVEPDVLIPSEAVFEVGYQPSRRGMYNVSVKWGNLDIPGSPFQVKCRKRILASEIHITNPSAGAYIGKPLKLRLVAEENEIDQEEKFTVFLRSSEGEEFPGMVERGESGSCVCTIDPPPRVGVYELHMLWTGEHIPDSPLVLEVARQPEPSDFTVGAAEMEGGAIAVRVNGPKCAFRCGELTASVENPATTEVLPVTAVQLSHEEYNIAFNPHKCGEYLLSILYDDNHIHGSPFRLIATDASLCYTKGKGLTAAQVGRENKFIVCTENAGTGELLVDMERDEETIEVLISAASETRYEVTYNPPALGRYKVSVQWDNKHIPGSPFEVLCVDATRYSVVKPPKETSLGKPIKVGVKLGGDKPPAYEKLDIFARSKDNHTFKGEVRKGNDGNYICTVLPPELGKYQLHVRCNGLDIPGSPLKAKVMPAPLPYNVRAYGEGLADGVIGQERLFTVQISDAGYGYLGFRVQGPKKGFHINMDRSDEEDIISAKYTPLYAGDYTISLLWSGVHIPGSPFRVSITESEDSGHDG